MGQLLTVHEMRQMQRSSKYSGLTQFDYTPKGTDLQLECWLEVEEAERGSREQGLQMEPDYPASATLCLAEVEGADIFKIISASTIEEIEGAFLSQSEEV